MEDARPNLIKTRAIDTPTYYVSALLGEFSKYAFDEERAPAHKSKWRTEFGVDEQHPLDLEIGTGNGYFFSHRAKTNPARCLVGLEIKFKPLIQAIRRALNADCKNVRAVRYDGKFVDHLFGPGELNHVFIHHPDPWEKQRRHKRRLVCAELLEKLYIMQRPGSFLEFKTDSQDYFVSAMEIFKKTQYQQERYTEDLHASAWSSENFVTHFELLFTQKGKKIHYARFIRP